ncbi:DUF6355 family natural product biosynthesis protein [Nonomuraea sp. NBC_00507]|uniref:DUF6355 family natural product biosynthesis protein n=1 Tax=Nonomuraea sp. NBC_00507 TaxID=2976002 RepID=UPI002E179CC1
MRTKILKVIGGTLTALALTTAPVYAGDGASSSAAGASDNYPCGYYYVEENLTSWYNHCNSNVNVLIRVERTDTYDYDRCVRPGHTLLGKRPIRNMEGIYYAWYKGVLC